MINCSCNLRIWLPKIKGDQHWNRRRVGEGIGLHPSTSRSLSFLQIGHPILISTIHFLDIFFSFLSLPPFSLHTASINRSLQWEHYWRVWKPPTVIECDSFTPPGSEEYTTWHGGDAADSIVQASRQLQSTLTMVGMGSALRYITKAFSVLVTKQRYTHLLIISFLYDYHKYYVG